MEPVALGVMIAAFAFIISGFVVTVRLSTKSKD